MTPTKRLSDIIMAVMLLLPLLPVMIVIGMTILVIEGCPVFYVSRRAKAPGKDFQLVKFRTMRDDRVDFGASGGHKSHRITRTGAFLRRTRLDELPQIWNILKGDLSFVGPRPPLPIYVSRFPDIYNSVLQSRPGVTGLASIYFHKHEELLLRNCKTPEENDRIYVTRCIPRKAHLDLIYARNRNLCMDVRLMLATVIRSLR